MDAMTAALASPTVARAVVIDEFDRAFAFTCTCRRRELRSAAGALVCAICDAPVVRRRTSAPLTPSTIGGAK